EGREPLRVRCDARPTASLPEPVARQVGSDDPRDVSKPVELGLPEVRGAAGAVDEDERRPGPRLDPGRRAPRDGTDAPGRLRHRTAPRAVIGQRASTRPPRTATYQS